MLRRLLPIVLLTLTVACGKDASPTGPSPSPTPTPTPTPSLYTIQGRVTSATGQALAGATVRVLDGPNAGTSASADGNGNYSLTGLSFAGFTVEASMPGYVGTSRGGILVSGVTTATANFSLLPATLWSQSGRGNQVFGMPSYVARVRITGTWDRTQTSNFIVFIGGRLVVNEILRQSITYEGSHLTGGGGVVQVTDSNQITWSMVEIR